jgi:hypothetical protein
MTKNETSDISTEQGTPSVALMWMHWTWFPCWPVAFVIWCNIKNKHPQARVHAQNINNAFVSFGLLLVLITAVIGFSPIFLWVLTLIAAAVFGKFNSGFNVGNLPDPVPFFSIIEPAIVLWFLIWIVCLVVNSISVGLAAKKGKVVPYWWAFIRLEKLGLGFFLP